MIRFKFNKEKWDSEVNQWNEVIGHSKSHHTFISPWKKRTTHYWDIKTEFDDYEFISKDLIKIDGDYLSPVSVFDICKDRWYSISDYYDYCKVVGKKFPDKFLWCVRDYKLYILGLN